MEPIPSTAEILALTALNISVDQRWVDWAIDMVEAGFETEHLLILAGEFKEPYNQFYILDLVDKVFKELRIDYSDKGKVVRGYACYVIDRTIDKKIDIPRALGLLTEITRQLDHEKEYFDFYLLYWAMDDLKYDDQQYYWPGADRSNFEQVAMDYFINWKANCKP